MTDRYLKFLLRMKEYEIDDLWEEIKRLQKEIERLKGERKNEGRTDIQK